MDTTIMALAILLALIIAALGGLGVGGLGADSRALEPTKHSDERSWRFLL